MRVLINGMPYFSRQLEKDLNELDDQNRYVFCDTYYSLWGRIRFILLLPFSKVVLSVNGLSTRSSSIDKVFRWKKKLIIQWHGTDVILAQERKANGTIYSQYIKSSKHLFSAPWFKDELAGIVKEGVYAPISYTSETGNDRAYQQFSVMTYFPEDNKDFYGWEIIREAALERPNLEFHIIGASGEGVEVPDNVKFYGWVDKQKLFNMLRSHPVFIRLTEHDGKSLMISQALGMGCEVIWTQPMQNCHYIERAAPALLDKLTELEESLKKREMSPNTHNISYAEKELNRMYVMKNFLRELKALMND